MDDATNEHYCMFFVDEEGTASSFQGVKDVILSKGLFCSLYTDRGSHYWHTPEAGGKVDKTNLTQFGRAMKQLDIDMIPACSPQARGRSERMFATHQDRLRMHYVKVKVRVLRYPDGTLAVAHEPHLLARYAADGQPLIEEINFPAASRGVFAASLNGSFGTVARNRRKRRGI